MRKFKDKFKYVVPRYIIFGKGYIIHTLPFAKTNSSKILSKSLWLPRLFTHPAETKKPPERSGFSFL
jgi:hypothetical protein